MILLKQTGFDGIITYECRKSLTYIPIIAKSINLKVIQGIWEPVNREELDCAAKLKDLVSAYCVGNEGMGDRYSMKDLDEGVTYLANITGLPVTISEKIHVYIQYPEIFRP